MPISRHEGESIDDWFSRIVSEEVKAGKPQDQAVAIAYSVTGKDKGKKVGKMVTVRVRREGAMQKQDQPRFVTIRGKRVPIAKPNQAPLLARTDKEMQEIAQRPTPRESKDETTAQRRERHYGVHIRYQVNNRGLTREEAEARYKRDFPKEYAFLTRGRKG